MVDDDRDVLVVAAVAQLVDADVRETVEASIDVAALPLHHAVDGALRESRVTTPNHGYSEQIR